MKELFEQIDIAAKKQPDMNLVDLINYVLKFKHPTKNFSTSYFNIFSDKIHVANIDIQSKWNVSNKDILEAFKTYNKIK